MCQYLVVQYTKKHQKYVPISSFTVHDETSEICVSIQLYRHDETSEISPSIQLYSTRRNIINMCQYLVVQYTTKHHKYVPISSYTVHDETSEICVNIQLYSTRRKIRNMCQYLVVQYMMKYQKYVSISSCTVHDET